MTELATRSTQAASVRVLGQGDGGIVVEMLDRDPYVNVFFRHRVESTRLDPRWMGAEVWGYFEGDELVSLLHVGANVVPASATPRAVAAFADRLLARGTRPGSLVGEATAIRDLWERLRPAWGPARSPRLDQPFMVLESDSVFPVDPRLRQVRLDELDLLYPACVAMFTEEVGIDPEIGNAGGYRARVAQLISLGWSYAVVENGEVLFKAEIGAATSHACQVQGVWVRPDRRGEGIAAPAMSALVRHARRHVAPVVTLYVNDHNVHARRAYERVGFVQTDTFASVLL